MLQCSLMLLVHSVLAAAAFRGNEKERCTESASRLSSPVEMLHGVWRYCSEMPHHHARGNDTEWKTSSLFCVCCCGCGCGRVGLVGTMAAEGIAHPTQHRFCRASSITLQHRNRRQQHAARQRMPPPPRVRLEGTRLMLRFEGAHCVAQWRAQNLIAGSAHDTGHWMWGVCVK
ncbi:trans-sialidase [Trypanosoma cruzi]|nr:trans-sialidase [Trypanosoma cruzi]